MQDQTAGTKVVGSDSEVRFLGLNSSGEQRCGSSNPKRPTLLLGETALPGLYESRPADKVAPATSQKGLSEKRLLDIALSCSLLVLLAPLFAVLALVVKASSPGPVLYTSDRVGLHNKIFRMPKFRSMLMNTPEVAPHLLSNAHRYLSPVGSFLRKSSLDELPQLWSILRGDLSFVGPRPALYNEVELVSMRTEVGVHRLTPGLTGWAQINGRNRLSMLEKVERDREYLERRSWRFDLQIVAITLVKVLRQDGVSH